MPRYGNHTSGVNGRVPGLLDGPQPHRGLPGRDLGSRQRESAG